MNFGTNGPECSIGNVTKNDKAYSGTLTRREIVRVKASLGEFRRV